jgi:stress-induced morphogen
MDAATLEALIRAGFPEATVSVEDVRGDGNHNAATIITSSFEGKTRVEQHRMVFRVLEGRIGDELHALQLTTRTGQGDR